MAILDILKKKKTEKESSVPLASKEKGEKEIGKPKKEAAVFQKERKIVPGSGYRILNVPHISEKATALAEINQYVFKVWPEVNKTEIKKAIEGQYGVKVMSVKIIKVLPKKRRLGKTKGWTKGYKKAIVKIKEGQKIEVLPR